MWTLESSLPVLRGLEPILVDHNAHCALGGSVLREGKSAKDLDIFIYSHDRKGYDKTSILVALANCLGWKDEVQLRFEYDDKDVVQVFSGSKRIDLFFL